jgi:hypothetical protein
MDFFSRDQRKTFVQIEAHLVAKNAFGARARAVCFGNAMGVDVLHKIFVLATDRAHKCQSVKTRWSLKVGAGMI